MTETNKQQRWKEDCLLEGIFNHQRCMAGVDGIKKLHLNCQRALTYSYWLMSFNQYNDMSHSIPKQKGSFTAQLYFT